jgi:hypothetical protein
MGLGTVSIENLQRHGRLLLVNSLASVLLTLLHELIPTMPDVRLLPLVENLAAHAESQGVLRHSCGSKNEVMAERCKLKFS